ncbi:hypothetical protein SAMD00019534_102000 [Acytostelium subglobosum LB1]|uniref:hypothetical protein n=1 Tax=Acytostelium subglobosum LB1 TaxID=1410327 RepID=UPI000644BFF4|nr:hypothetical protein SAMD00019534_102000 [Acytostelium subglobosum LB1]GAM27025.1 hypothetical protein SAMD00019534_102000 [Acytostelium subglobosum LB1]|eukprot:XP_012749905.1 hypothetical protein SAMD00019534_102000 [Acytostelium subglobosum LB1]
MASATAIAPVDWGKMLNEMAINLVFFTPAYVVHITKCLSMLREYDFLRRRQTPHLMRFAIYFVSDFVSSTLFALMLGVSPKWLHNNVALTINLTIWFIYSLFPPIIRILDTPLGRALELIFMTTKVADDIISIYDLPMSPNQPWRQGSYGSPVLPPSLLGSLFLSLTKAVSGSLIKNLFLNHYKPGKRSPLSDPSISFKTAAIMSILYHFLANPHAGIISSVFVVQLIQPLQAKFIMHLVYGPVLVYEFLTSKPSNSLSRSGSFYSKPNKKLPEDML